MICARRADLVSQRQRRGIFVEYGSGKNVEQGAATSIWAAVAPELEGVGGFYLEDCAIAKPWSKDRPMSGVMPYALDADRAERLWAVSEELTAGVRRTA